MLKSKIIFTIFVVYEIIAVMLLHCPRTCDAMFGTVFCDDHVFKYFLFCAAVPLIAFLIWMWIHEIFIARRRRRSFLHRARDVMADVADSVKERAGKTFNLSNISRQDMDKYLAAAILFGLKKYSDRHPGLRNTVRDIIDSANGRYEYDDTDDDIDDAEYDAPTRTRQSGATRARTASGRTTAAQSKANPTSRRKKK